MYRLTGYFKSGERASAAAEAIRRALPYARPKERALDGEGFDGSPPWLFGACGTGAFESAGFFAGAVSPFPPSFPLLARNWGQADSETRESGASYRVAVCVEEKDRPLAERLLQTSGAFGTRAERMRS